MKTSCSKSIVASTFPHRDLVIVLPDDWVSIAIRNSLRVTRPFGARLITNHVRVFGKETFKDTVLLEFEFQMCQNKKIAKNTLQLGGLTCEACVRVIQDRLRDLPGVQSIQVSLYTQTYQSELFSGSAMCSIGLRNSPFMPF